MKNLCKKLFGFLAITIVLPNICTAQHPFLDTAWVAQTPEISEAIYHSSSVVHQGNLIVTGNVDVGGDIDVVTLKYGVNGDTLWMKTQSGSLTDGADYGVDVKINASGDVIVIAAIENTGTDYDYAVYQYDGSTGNLDWSYTWNGTGGGNDIPTTVELDGSGNVYVAGGSEALGGFGDYGVIKLSSTGTFQWAAYYDYTSLHDAATKIVINSQIVVTGISASGIGDWDLATIKLNPATGAIGSTNRTDIAGATMVEASDMVTDSLSNMYITGYAEIAGNKNVQTIKLDSNLTEVWIKNYSGTFDDEGKDLAVDVYGNVYVTGYTGKSAGLFKALTIKYDASGNEIWVKEFGNIENSVEGRAEKIALNDSGEVFITGTIADQGNISSFFFTQYSADGLVLLSTEYNSLGLGDTAYNIHVVADSVYITGLSHYVGTTQMTAIKFVLLQNVDYSYFYLNGEKSVWCQQPGMYSFALIDSSRFVDVDSTIVSHSDFFPDDGIHYIYFDPEASESEIDSMITVIESQPNFYKEYLVATQTRNNTQKYANELYAGIDNYIEIVFNDPDLTDTQVDSFATSNQLDVVYYPPSGIDGGVFILKANQNYTNHSLTSATLTMDIAADLWEEDTEEFIKIVTPSLRLFRPHDGPDDPYYDDMWWAIGSETTCNGTATDPTANIGLDCAWNFEFDYGTGPSYSGDGVVVGVIDYHGVQWDHPDLDGSFLDGWAAFGDVEGEAAVVPIYNDADDVYYAAWNEAHLQNVSGIISADIDNTEGIVGVAHESMLIPSLWSGTTAQFDGLLQELLTDPLIERQVDIINMSFGYNGMTVEEAMGFGFYSSLQACHLSGRDGKGIVLVASAGNRNGEYISIPAAMPMVFSVGATNPVDQIKKKYDGFDPIEGNWGSSYFKDLDVVAPGVCIMSTDFSDEGTGFPEDIGIGYAVGDYYGFSGTSAAAPMVSGLAALLLEKDADLTNEEVYEIIRLSSDKVGGYDYTTMEPNGRCLELGYGRINACTAVYFNNEELKTEEDQTNLINITYVNPVTDILYVNVHDLQNFSVIMYNPTGQLVFDSNYKNTSTFDVDMSSFANGIYFLSVFDEKTQRNTTVKILKK
ncbi:S8 family serine peptidase [Crocinitomix algicola]|uniref:S8 family serine peptidase n=1 Tax=Crocinitomix algicola TaxID=1740263 RepID=UPI00083559AF|nr:S8 family serine peptidase [Crocinitomix algicola]